MRAIRAGAFLSDTKKQARKARNRERRASAAAEKQVVALKQAGVPQHRWPGINPDTAPGNPTIHRVLLNGIPAIVDPDMASSEEPVGWVRVEDRELNTHGVSLAKPGQTPTFWTVSKPFYAQLKARTAGAASSSSMPASPKIVVLPRQGIDAPRIEVTGLGRGAVASFTRAPNPALKHYLNRNLITLREYEAGLQLYFDFEDAQIPPGAVLDPTRDFVTGGGWRDFAPARLDSLNRLRAALSKVGGTIGQQMVFDVCCLGKLLVTQRYDLYERRGSQMPRLKEGLQELGKYYGPFLKR
ncbi:DUF6456 domain-containing protein (plasmid) [Skermanella rosea]|uniref:DUF6456 domain-containing protein n=1 Tax=Skermanella rosea TaxID=1817965 RepID=UPI00193365C8|nr:DUF6456 domain-containing protein [Skermanella rosea]UEM08079.1 DUF6456 domain-containing protein [Skermanella rosea]